MSTQTQTPITVTATVHAPVQKIWEYWSKPEHIIQWAFASDDWHVTHAENDFRPGGKFTTRMEAKDGSMGFDFGGTNDEVREHEYTSYTMDDGRKAAITFEVSGDECNITETFDPEGMNPPEMQRAGWQAILDNFKKYAEAKG